MKPFTSLWIVELDTESFSWRAFGRTEAEARRALQLAWHQHVVQTGADPGYVNALEDGNAMEVRPGECYRDDYRMIKNLKPVREK